MNVQELENHLDIINSAEGLLGVPYLEALTFIIPGSISVVFLLFLFVFLQEEGIFYGDTGKRVKVSLLLVVLTLSGGVTTYFFANNSFHGDMEKQWAERSEYQSILAITNFLNKSHLPKTRSNTKCWVSYARTILMETKRLKLRLKLLGVKPDELDTDTLRMVSALHINDGV